MSLYYLEGTLRPVAPFNFSQSLKFLSDFSSIQNEQVVKTGSITKALQVKGKTTAFKVIDNGMSEKPLLKYKAYSEARLTYEIQELIADRICFFLSIIDNLRVL